MTNISQYESRGSWPIGLSSIACAICIIVIGYLWFIGVAMTFDAPGYLEKLTPVQKIFNNMCGILFVTLICDIIATVLLMVGGIIIILNRKWWILAQTGTYLSLFSGIGKVIGSFLCVPVWISFMGTSKSLLIAGELLLPEAGYAVYPLILFVLLRKMRKELAIGIVSKGL